ncbi:MAG: hypothetical protein M8467_08185 [Anaerolineae bacterium]|nr:hypothetical protein [Anaerolineae bacterium]
MSQPEDIRWLCHPEAENYVAGHLEQFTSTMAPVHDFVADLWAQTSTRLIDWLDHLVLAGGDRPESDLRALGFEREEVEAGDQDTVFYHPGTMLPRILLRRETGAEPATPLAVAIQTEDIGFFLMTHHLTGAIEGSPVSPYRRAVAWRDGGRELLVVERRGHSGFVPTTMPPDYPERYLRGFERWAVRPRLFDDELEGMRSTLALAQSLVSDLGTDTAAWVAFAAERAHWQRRNRAGKVQKARQDTLGLGWANHDHHTFRSSRATFPLLIQVLETFGFQVRERFYAGAQAGWGAQVMEQPVCRFAVFADVDLSPEEVGGDFAHQPLAPRDELGTVGLWCALHGESMLGAGLHHLAARLGFDQATADLAEWDVGMMRPFSDFPYLRQAFTRGERWQVAPQRLDRLVTAGQIDASQRARFAEEGAIGSHLENIQRAQGFKGFNQETVSDIIRRTDPRGEIGA